MFMTMRRFLCTIRFIIKRSAKICVATSVAARCSAAAAIRALGKRTYRARQLTLSGPDFFGACWCADNALQVPAESRTAWSKSNEESDLERPGGRRTQA